MRPQHEGLEEPRRVRQVPLGRAGVGHRLDRLVLRRQRRSQLLGAACGQPGSARRRSEPCAGTARVIRLDTTPPHRSQRPATIAGCNAPVAHSLWTAFSRRPEDASADLRDRSVAHSIFRECRLCPPDVFIPTEDSDGWLWNPAHRWVYDKLAVAMSQGLEAAPHGVAPQNYPVFSKPIYNLKGMGVGSRRSALGRRLHHRLPAGSFLVDPARRRPCQQRCRAGRRRAAVVAPRRRGVTGGAALSTTGRSAPKPSPRSRTGAAHGAASISRATPACSTSRPSAAASSRCICASPINGPISTVAGWVEALVRLYAKREWQFDDSATTHRLQRRAVRATRLALPPSAGRPAADHRGDARRVEPADHLSRRAAARAACHAAGRLSRRHRQLLGSRRRQCGARAAARPLRGDRRLPARSYAAGSRRTG